MAEIITTLLISDTPIQNKTWKKKLLAVSRGWKTLNGKLQK